MTRILAHGPDRLFRPDGPALVIALDDYAPGLAAQADLARVAEAVVLGGADVLLVTFDQVDALTSLLPRVAMIVHAASQGEIGRASDLGLDGVIVARAKHVAAAREAGLAPLTESSLPGVEPAAIILRPAKVGKRPRPVPYLILLDELLPPKELLARLGDLGPARGVILGRAVWGYHSPQAMTRAIVSVLRGAQPPTDAARALSNEEDEGGNPACLVAEL